MCVKQAVFIALHVANAVTHGLPDVGAAVGLDVVGLTEGDIVGLIVVGDSVVGERELGDSEVGDKLVGV